VEKINLRALQMQREYMEKKLAAIKAPVETEDD
jgi:hypothetical protein